MKKTGPKSLYTPPFTITAAIVSLVAEISSMLGRHSAINDRTDNLRLRKINRVRTIHGSLAIEGNTLSEEQITAILEGKKVIAPPREIQEVRNAIRAYEHFDKWDPSSRKDLLEAHKILMTGLLDRPGQFRTGNVGIMAGEKLVHMAPPADIAVTRMNELLSWLKTTEQHPLIAGSVFHYEFEFIHPFDDGNGRMGRLWQTLILSRWNSIFASVPVESLVYEHQAEYYAALNTSNEKAESSTFIEFMLVMIRYALVTGIAPEVNPEVTPEVRRMLAVMDGDMTRKEIQEKLGLKDEKNFREKYLQPAIAAGFVEMTIPDKPNSRLQGYRLTGKGEGLSS